MLLDEDILAFTPTTLGANTSGTWAMYFDGSDVGLAETNNEDIDALDVAANGDIYLSTIGVFSVTGVSGDDEDVFVCAPDFTGKCDSLQVLFGACTLMAAPGDRRATMWMASTC